MKNVVQCGPSITIIKQFSGPTLKRATKRCIYLSPQRCLNMETDAGKSDKQLITWNLRIKENIVWENFSVQAYQPLGQCEINKRPRVHVPYEHDRIILGAKYGGSSFLLRPRLTSSRGENDADNETIQRKCFSKNENQNHADKELWLLCVGPEINT